MAFREKQEPKIGGTNATLQASLTETLYNTAMMVGCWQEAQRTAVSFFTSCRHVHDSAAVAKRQNSMDYSIKTDSSHSHNS